MTLSEEEESVHSGMSVPSIGEDAQDPQVRHLIVSEECCRAVTRSSDGNNHICPRIMDVCHKRNHIRVRATNRGEAGIYQIHRGVRGAYRGVLADVPRLSPEEHTRLIQEARDRNRASAALAAGAGTLTGAPEQVATVPPAPTAPGMEAEVPATTQEPRLAPQQPWRKI
jgi:hypothetical protein